MKKIISIILIFIFVVCSLAYANAVVDQAYSLYIQGKKQEAVKMLEDYIRQRLDPAALYLLGYMYYEQGDTERARRYFEDAYLIDPEFSPVKK
jgi:tetratricopeptide (TPR) repeat protein